jgi:hypothetical protein
MLATFDWLSVVVEHRTPILASLRIPFTTTWSTIFFFFGGRASVLHVHTLSSGLTAILLVFKIVDEDEEKEEQPLGQMIKLKRLEVHTPSGRMKMSTRMRRWTRMRKKRKATLRLMLILMAMLRLRLMLVLMLMLMLMVKLSTRMWMRMMRTGKKSKQEQEGEDVVRVTGG